MPGGLGLTELLVVLAIVLLIFGPRRLKSIGADLGNAIKGFRKAVTDDEAKAAHADAEADAIEGEVTARKAEAKQETHV